jgi:hypothetical protein
MKEMKMWTDEGYDYSSFSKEELQLIVDAHFAGYSASKYLEKVAPNLCVYTMSKSFCDGALDFLINNSYDSNNDSNQDIEGKLVGNGDGLLNQSGH